MKKSNNIVTEQFLEEKLEEKLLEFRKDIMDEMREEMFDMREGIISQMDEKSRGYRDDVLTGLDKVMKELETMREENSVGNFQANERFENHEQRITSLESVSQQ